MVDQKDLYRWVIISVMVLCNDIVIIEYDRRRAVLPNAPVDMEYGNNIAEESTAIAIALNIQHNDKPLQKKLNPLMHVRTSDIDVRDR